MGYNMDRRTNYGIHYHETFLIKRLEEKLKGAKTPHKRERYAKRIINARARLLAHVLAKE